MRSSNRRAAGALAEEQALRYLEAKGYTLLDRNFRTVHGEIDLIMAAESDSCLVFVEVKSGNQERFPGYFEAIDARKCAKIAQVAAEYLENRSREYPGYRIDAVFVDRGLDIGIQHLEDVYCMT